MTNRRFKSSSDLPYVAGEGKYLPENRSNSVPKNFYLDKRPRATGEPFSAKHSSNCRLCKQLIRVGNLVVAAVAVGERLNGKKVFVHPGCAD